MPSGLQQRRQQRSLASVAGGSWIESTLSQSHSTLERERGLMAAYRLVHKIWEPSSSTWGSAGVHQGV